MAPHRPTTPQMSTSHSGQTSSPPLAPQIVVIPPSIDSSQPSLPNLLASEERDVVFTVPQSTFEGVPGPETIEASANPPSTSEKPTPGPLDTPLRPYEGPGQGTYTVVLYQDGEPVNENEVQQYLPTYGVSPTTTYIHQDCCLPSTPMCTLRANAIPADLHLIGDKNKASDASAKRPIIVLRITNDNFEPGALYEFCMDHDGADDLIKHFEPAKIDAHLFVCIMMKRNVGTVTAEHYAELHLLIEESPDSLPTYAVVEVYVAIQGEMRVVASRSAPVLWKPRRLPVRGPAGTPPPYSK